MELLWALGLPGWSLVFVPFILVLEFLTGRQLRSWPHNRKPTLVIAWILAVLLSLGVLFLPIYAREPIFTVIR
jgi:hypothetical protein